MYSNPYNFIENPIFNLSDDWMISLLAFAVIYWNNFHLVLVILRFSIISHIVTFRPMDLSTIKKNIENGVSKCLKSFTIANIALKY